jgi:hypothetical protein
MWKGQKRENVKEIARVKDKGKITNVIGEEKHGSLKAFRFTMIPFLRRTTATSISPYREDSRKRRDSAISNSSS